MATAVTLLLSGCDPIGNIGVTPLTPVETLFTDTLTVRTSTVLADSVRTGSPDFYLAGRYVDPIFGTVTASSFIRMALDVQLDLGLGAVYDSLTLNMQYSYAYGDTLPVQTFAVHRIRETIDPAKTYYNDSRVAYDPAPLDKRTIKPTPRSANTGLQFRLPDELGRELFAISGQDAGKTNVEFAKVLNGFALIPDAKNTVVLGFPAIGNSLTLNLWYHTTTDSTRKAFSATAIAINPQTRQTIFRAGFNRVTADRSGTPLAGLKPLVPRPAGDGPAYVQEALGIHTKIEIPYLRSLGKGKSVAINRAELSIKPDLTAATTSLFIPNFLVLIETDSTNRVAYRPLSSLTAIVQQDAFAYDPRPIPQVAQYNSRFQNYTFKLTTQLNGIRTGAKKNNSFLVAPIYTNAIPDQGGAPYQSQLNNRVTRLVLGSKPGDVKLIVFYTEAKE